MIIWRGSSFNDEWRSSEKKKMHEDATRPLSENYGRSISGKCEMYSKVFCLLETFPKKWQILHQMMAQRNPIGWRRLEWYLKVKQSWTIANKMETSLWMRFNEKWGWFWPISQTWGRFCVEFLWPAPKYLSSHLNSLCLAFHCRHFKWKYNFCWVFANVCKKNSCQEILSRLIQFKLIEYSW